MLIILFFAFSSEVRAWDINAGATPEGRLEIMRLQLDSITAQLFIMAHQTQDSAIYAVLPPETILRPIDELDAVLGLLERCESGGNPLALNPNDGGSRSVGVIQYKDVTFEKYLKRYSLAGDIWNPEDQLNLARRMLEEDWNNWRHWTNCWNTMNLPKSHPSFSLVSLKSGG